jgi:hypothetical protein
VRLLGGERQLFDSEVEPDSKREGEEDAEETVRQERRLSWIRFDVEELVDAPHAREHGHDGEYREDRDRDDGDDNRELERDGRTSRVQQDEDRVENDPPQPAG